MDCGLVLDKHLGQGRTPPILIIDQSFSYLTQPEPLIIFAHISLSEHRDIKFKVLS